ncbi:MAG: N(G),N(G)-dimethylarginine dimethylaminohydrolase [bacterium]|nr:N(G),N(G)-dimethylarginine dimethylaminohydrolase [bacterium]
MFRKAIVKTPGRSLSDGICNSSDLGRPVYEKALRQHRAYINILEECGVDVMALHADEDYPDSTFVEDTAVLIEDCAIITNPGAESRKGEIFEIHDVLQSLYDNIEMIYAPGDLEGGDVMMVGRHCYIGLSLRTNLQGAQQLVDILKKYDYTASIVPLKAFLHLKTGISYLEDNILLISGEFVGNPSFENFRQIIVEPDEAYAANSIRVNDCVIVPEGFPTTEAAIEEADLPVKAVYVSEFRKLNGGLSCLSLRF